MQRVDFYFLKTPEVKHSLHFASSKTCVLGPFFGVAIELESSHMSHWIIQYFISIGAWLSRDPLHCKLALVFCHKYYTKLARLYSETWQTFKHKNQIQYIKKKKKADSVVCLNAMVGLIVLLSSWIQNELTMSTVFASVTLFALTW